jgi:hypothetical protein
MRYSSWQRRTELRQKICHYQGPESLRSIAKGAIGIGGDKQKKSLS